MVNLDKSQLELLESISDGSSVKLDEKTTVNGHYLERVNLAYISYIPSESVETIRISPAGKAYLHAHTNGEILRHKSEIRDKATLWLTAITLVVAVISLLHSYGAI